MFDSIYIKGQVFTYYSQHPYNFCFFIGMDIEDLGIQFSESKCGCWYSLLPQTCVCEPSGIWMSTWWECGTVKLSRCTSIYILHKVAPELLEMVLSEIPHTAAMGYQRKHYLKEGTSYEHCMKGTTATGFKKKIVSHYSLPLCALQTTWELCNLL